MAAQKKNEFKQLKDGKFGCNTCDLVFATPGDATQHTSAKRAHRFYCPVPGCGERSRMFSVSGRSVHLSEIHKYRFLCRHAHVDASCMYMYRV